MKNKKKETNAMKRCARKLTAGLLAGAMVLSMPVVAEAGSWKHNSRGWWWYNDDWSYPANSWKTIYGKDYHREKIHLMRIVESKTIQIAEQ